MAGKHFPPPSSDGATGPRVVTRVARPEGRLRSLLTANFLGGLTEEMGGGSRCNSR